MWNGTWEQYSTLNLDVYGTTNVTFTNAWVAGTNTATNTFGVALPTNGVAFLATVGTNRMTCQSGTDSNLTSSAGSITGWVSYVTGYWFIDFGEVATQSVDVVGYFRDTNALAYAHSGYMENEHEDGTTEHKMRSDLGGPDLGTTGLGYFWRARAMPALVSSNMPAGVWCDWEMFFGPGE